MQGRNIAGASSTRKRVENDYYATPFEATRKFLDTCPLKNIQKILEPCAGEGHISTILRERFPSKEITSTDLVKRRDLFNCNIQGGIDFLKEDFSFKYDLIITNPPFKDINKFITKGLHDTRRYLVLFGKIQLLETKERKELLELYPLKYIYVHSKRVNPMRNGSEVDENGKKWASTMCFAWFVWDKQYIGEPIVRWL